ncbi:MAG: DNA primase small subunit domain-containing protein, partial [Candidatus Bathyarchaeia archaeon]
MSLDVVRGYFREYYSSSKLSPPRDMEKREFGFLAFGKNIMLRHRTFRDLNELRGFIVRRVPAHVYHSAAYYTHPSEDMGGKGWVGASLIFDIDADHLPTPCKEAHDSWICESCGRGGKGKGPGTCECGGRIREDVWFCEECLEAAKAEVIKLLAILFDDFGLAPGKVRVYFSGHRGFHVHVDDEELGGLDQLQRKEIVDYLTATGLKIDKIISEVETGAGKLIFGPSTGDPGWRGRLARGVYDFLIGATEERMGKTGLGLETIRKLIKNRESMAEPSDIPWNLKGLGLQSWRKIAMSALENERVRIDTVVTTDI